MDDKEKLSNPKVTIQTIQKYGFRFQKRYGQNFLIDDHVIRKILRAADITKEDTVVEIGPGIGTLTQSLAAAAGQVYAVEIDEKLLPILADTLSSYENVEVIHNDILKCDLNRLLGEGNRCKIVANLPYYITTPIIMGLLEGQVPAESITVMVQKEVAERMDAGPGSKIYGALSLAVQYYADTYLADNTKARLLHSNGRYHKIKSDDDPFCAQDALMDSAVGSNQTIARSPQRPATSAFKTKFKKEKKKIRRHIINL